MENKEQYIILRLLSIKGFGPKTINKLIDGLHRIDNDLPDLLIDHNLFKKILPSIKEEQIKDFFENNYELDTQFEEAKSQGYKFLPITSKLYPRKIIESLKFAAPPILTYKGNLQLIDYDSVGFCGSRQASTKGISVAQDCAEQLVAHSISILSGYAAGVDQATHYSALKYGGSTIIVLPESILNFSIRNNLKEVWDWNRVLVISEFSLNAIWTTSRAMLRNSTIISLSDIMILIESSKNGGSMDAGRKTLGLNKKLFVPVYEGMPEFAIGNRVLLENGAIKLMKSKNTGKADIRNLLEALKENHSTIYSTYKQTEIDFSH